MFVQQHVLPELRELELQLANGFGTCQVLHHISRLSLQVCVCVSMCVCECKEEARQDNLWDEGCFELPAVLRRAKHTALQLRILSIALCCDFRRRVLLKGRVHVQYLPASISSPSLFLLDKKGIIIINLENE